MRSQRDRNERVVADPLHDEERIASTGAAVVEFGVMQSKRHVWRKRGSPSRTGRLEQALRNRLALPDQAFEGRQPLRRRLFASDSSPNGPVDDQLHCAITTPCRANPAQTAPADESRPPTNGPERRQVQAPTAIRATWPRRRMDVRPAASG